MLKKQVLRFRGKDIRKLVKHARNHRRHLPTVTRKAYNWKDKVPFWPGIEYEVPPGLWLWNGPTFGLCLHSNALPGPQGPVYPTNRRAGPLARGRAFIAFIAIELLAQLLESEEIVLRVTGERVEGEVVRGNNTKTLDLATLEYFDTFSEA